jgi:hypothetical protein
MKEIIITITSILLVSAATTPAFAQDEWFEVAEASAISYDVVISREVPAAETLQRGEVLNMMRDSKVTALNSPTVKFAGSSEGREAVTGVRDGDEISITGAKKESAKKASLGNK